MYAAIAGAVLGAAGSVYSGIKADKEKKKYQNALLESQRAAEGRQNYWENISPDQTRAYQQVVRDAREQFDDYIKRREGQDAIMGTDNSSKARAEAARGMSQAIEGAAADAESRIDRKAEMAERQVDAIKTEQRNGYLQNAQNNQVAGSQALQAGLNMTMADAQSHLDSGKGLMENLWKKKNK